MFGNIRSMRPLLVLIILLFITCNAYANQTCNKDNKEYTPKSRFKINTDSAEVFDTKTKLTWKICLEGRTYNNGRCLGTNSDFEFNEAIAQYNNISETSWRLPSAEELESISEFNCKNPASNLEVFPDTPKSKYIWTHETKDKGNAYIVLTSSGDIAYAGTEKGWYASVRLVRGAKWTKESIRIENKELCKSMEKLLPSLGISKRMVFKQGKLGERLIPVTKNTYATTDVLYQIGNEDVKKTTIHTSYAGGYNEDISGYYLIYDINNNSNKDYIVYVFFDSTITKTHIGTRTSILDTILGTGDSSLSREMKSEDITIIQPIIVKSNTSFKGQIPAGEKIPVNYLFGILKVVEIDRSWINNLNMVLGAKINNIITAKNIIKTLDAFLADSIAEPWERSLKSKKVEAVKFINQDTLKSNKKYISFDFNFNSNYDPDFENDVNLVITNKSLSEKKVSFNISNGSSISVSILPKQTVTKTIQVKGIAKRKLSATIISID